MIWRVLILLTYLVGPAEADCTTCHYGAPPTRFNVRPEVLVARGLIAPAPLVLDPIAPADEPPLAATPEPGTLLLLGTTLVLLGRWARR